MSSNNFPKKWLQSSRGLPGSFMNENHHTMTHIWKDDSRQARSTENQTSSTDMNHDRQPDHQMQQHNEMDDMDLLGQEPQRSILGPHNNEFQSQQANFPHDGDFYSRPKTKEHPAPITTMFPQDHLAGGLHKIDQEPPHKHMEKVTELGNDPDPATKAAFQSTTKPMMTKQVDEPSKPQSVAASVGSNRAIKNQPLVSDPIDQDVDDYDDDADYYTTSEVMPATYVDNSKPIDDMNMETPPNARTPVATSETAGPTSKDNKDKATPNSDEGTKEEKMAPLQASDMYHQQEQNVSPSNIDSVNDTEAPDTMNTDKGPTEEEAPIGTNSQQQESLSSLKGDNSIQNSLGGIGDKYKNQNPTNPPFAQNVSPEANNEEHDVQMPSYQDDPALSQTNTDKPEGHRRSSLTQSIGKLFSRHHK